MTFTLVQFALSGLPSPCSAVQPQFHKILNSSAKHHIPQCHIHNMTHNFTETTKRLIDVPDAFRSPSPTDLYSHELNAQISHNFANSNIQNWTQTVESCSQKRAKTPCDQPITLSYKSLTCNGEIVTVFPKQITFPVLHYNDPSTQIVKRKHFKECPLDSSIFHLSPDIVSQAIKNSGKSFAAGQDGRTIHNLINLGPLGHQYLAHLSTS